MPGPFLPVTVPKNSIDDMDGKVIRIVFDLLNQFGVETIVCSSGSRNVSLLMEADLWEEKRKYVVVDERCAGFIALGNALVSRKPVALVCTSGTALLNYAPAIAEAYYQNLPLIVLSADRPMEWIDQDDSQTIRQPGVFSNYCKYFVDLDACRQDSEYLWYVNRIVNEGLITSLLGRKGPVHFNIHLPGTPINPLPRYTTAGHKFDVVCSDKRLDKESLKELATKACGKKIMVTAGFMPPDHRIQRGMSMLASLPNVCVMAETISNLHLSPECYKIDAPLFSIASKNVSPLEIEKFRPDILISIGGALVSRQLKEFLRQCTPEQHWSVGEFRNVVDCFQSLTSIFDMNPAGFIPYFAKRLKRTQAFASDIPQYSLLWKNLRDKTSQSVQDLPWCDLMALRTIFRKLPSSCNLFLSNGTAVRYAQILNHVPPHASYCNRGVSGIEGSTSTAIGGMLAYPDMTVLITGDLSFAYDIGALGTDLADGRLKVVVLNNGGGDIFRFVKATSGLKIREKYLCADMGSDLRMIASTYGWNYYEASNYKTLLEVLPDFFNESDSPCLLDIQTARDNLNADTLRSFLNISSSKTYPTPQK